MKNHGWAVWTLVALFLFAAIGVLAEEPVRAQKARDISEIGVPYTPTADMVATVTALRTERRGMRLNTNADDPSAGLQEEPYGIIINEFVDDARSRAYFQTTRASHGAIVIFKSMEFPDGEQKVFPGWFVEQNIQEGESYIFSLWDGSAGAFWGFGGNIGVTVYTFNLVTGKFSFLHETLASWRGSSVYKNVRIAGASADDSGGPAVRVKVLAEESPDSSPRFDPRFFIDGNPVGEKSVLSVGTNVYDVYPPENQRYGGDRLLTVRVGTWCDSIRVRYFDNSAKGAAMPPDR